MEPSYERPGMTRASTSGHHDVGRLHRGFDVLLERRLHKLVVLFDDAADVPPALRDVPLQPPNEADVRVRVHEHLHVQQLVDRIGRNDCWMEMKPK